LICSPLASLWSAEEYPYFEVFPSRHLQGVALVALAAAACAYRFFPGSRRERLEFAVLFLLPASCCASAGFRLVNATLDARPAAWVPYTVVGRVGPSRGTPRQLVLSPTGRPRALLYVRPAGGDFWDLLDSSRVLVERRAGRLGVPWVAGYRVEYRVPREIRPFEPADMSWSARSRTPVTTAGGAPSRIVSADADSLPASAPGPVPASRPGSGRH